MFTSLFLRSLNREAASAGNKPEEILGKLEIREGYAIDTRAKYLDFIRQRAEGEGLNNIVLMGATEMESKLPQAGLDLIFARNVFHHLPEPASYFQSLRVFLKPGGRVVIIEHRPKKGFSFVALFKHHTPAETIIQGMDKAGYRFLSAADFLPDQTFTVFGLKQIH